MYEELLNAILKRDLKTVKELLQKISDKPKLYQLTPDNMTALSLGAQVGDLEIFQELFEHFRQGDLNNPPKLFLAECTSALREAAAAGHLEIIKFLMQNKQNPLPSKYIIEKAVKPARHSGDTEIIIPTSEHSGTFRKAGHTAISLAVRYNKMEVLSYLLPLAARVPSVGDYGYDERNLSAVELAIESGNVEALKLLYSNGSEMTHRISEIAADESKLDADTRARVKETKDFHNSAYKFYQFMRMGPDKAERHKHLKEIEELMALLGGAILFRFARSYLHEKTNHYCFNYSALNFAILNYHDIFGDKILKMSNEFLLDNERADTFLSDAARVGCMKLVKHFVTCLSATHPRRDRILLHALEAALVQGDLEIAIFLSNKFVMPGISFLSKSEDWDWRSVTKNLIQFNKVEILNFLINKQLIHKDLRMNAKFVMDTVLLQEIWMRGPQLLPRPNIESAKLLLCLGAYPFIESNGRWTIEKIEFHNATREIFKLIAEEVPSKHTTLESKLNLQRYIGILGNAINVRHPESLDTPLHIAIHRKNRAYLLQLLETDPNINITNKKGETAYTLGMKYLETNPDPLLRTTLNCSRSASLIEEIYKGFQILLRWKESEFETERLKAETELWGELGNFAKELSMLLPDCIAASQELNMKIARLKDEILPDDKEAMEELINCKKVPAKMCLRLGAILASPEERPLAPMHAYRILKQVDKSSEEAFRQANRIMYRLVLQYPELILYFNFANYDKEKEIIRLFLNEISELSARLNIGIGALSKKEAESDISISASDKGASTFSKTSVVSQASVPSEKSLKSQALSLEEDQDSLDTDLQSEHNKNLILEKTLAHLVHAEFGDEDENSALPNMIIAYTRCTGKEGSRNLQGIPKFKDFKDSSSFLALLKIIREENIRTEEEMGSRLAVQEKDMAKTILDQKKAILQLKQALSAFDPNHPLLQIPESESIELRFTQKSSAASPAILLGFDHASETPQTTKLTVTRKFY